MQDPYTSAPVDALIVAQASVAMVLGAALWFRAVRPRAAMVLLLSAIALAVIAPVGTAPFAEGEFLRNLGLAVGPHFAKPALKTAAALATLAMLLTRRRPLAILAALGEVVLWPITDFIQRCDAELAAAHMAFFGLLVGATWREKLPASPTESEDPPSSGSFREDMAAFVLASLAGAIVCRAFLHGWTESADEWANTFQAGLFAKLRASGSVPRCAESFRAYWVYQYMGRSFAQYTPGWPLFMTPFVRFGAPWLAGPASLGLLAAAVMRLGRRAATGFSEADSPPSTDTVLLAGRLAALALVLSPTMLLNGGARFSHVFVAATFAWSVEALCTVATAGLTPRAQWGWGAALGLGAGLMLAARPLDGGTLGLGLLLYFVYAAKRGRVAWRAASGAISTFAVIGAATLVILRLQLGRWFTTGYSLTAVVYPWDNFGWSVPPADGFKWGIPIASGSYWWWPCSPAVALLGLAALRGRARGLAFIFFVSCSALFVSYTLSEFGRKLTSGYGPRYLLPSVVPMAVGTGVVLARLLGAARARLPGKGGQRAVGPASLACAAALLGVLRIAPLVYPDAYAALMHHNWLRVALGRLDLHDAVVFGGKGDTTDPLDLPENMPLDLYPPADVLFAIDLGPEAARCVREDYPDRAFYRAVFGHPAQIVPY
jgi:hypothetical protein